MIVISMATRSICLSVRIKFWGMNKGVLPFMLPKLQEPKTAPQVNDDLVRRLQEGRARSRAVQHTVECLEPAPA